MTDEAGGEKKEEDEDEEAFKRSFGIFNFINKFL